MTVEEKIKKYQEYCKKTGCPDFLPHSGICFDCRKQIWDVLKNPESCHTSCPHCCKSYCD